MKKLIRSVLLAALAAAVLVSCQKTDAAAKPAAGPTAGLAKIKAGFVYVGPVGDYGWSNAHDQGRKYAESLFGKTGEGWLETTIVESVLESDSLRIIDRLVNEEGCNVIFTTSFGYMDDTVKAAAKYPNVLFMHCSGFKNGPNLGTYYSELYQMYYLNGLMAGALSKTGKAGYVGAFPISEVIRHINAFALGVKAADPKATVTVRWINSWYAPDKAKEAAQALVAEGVDALAFTEDSPAVIEVAQERTKKGNPVIAFSHYSPMQSFGEDAVVSGELVDWGIMYAKILKDIHQGTWKNDDLWWKAKEKAALLGGKLGEPINAKFIPALKAKMIDTPDLGKISAYDLVMKRLAAFEAETFEPFTGPIKDQSGKEQLAKGAVATKGDLLSIQYFVDNVKGEIPKP